MSPISSVSSARYLFKNRNPVKGTKQYEFVDLKDYKAKIKDATKYKFLAEIKTENKKFTVNLADFKERQTVKSAIRDNQGYNAVDVLFFVPVTNDGKSYEFVAKSFDNDYETPPNWIKAKEAHSLTKIGLPIITAAIVSSATGLIIGTPIKLLTIALGASTLPFLNVLLPILFGLLLFTAVVLFMYYIPESRR